MAPHLVEENSRLRPGQMLLHTRTAHKCTVKGGTVFTFFSRTFDKFVIMRSFESALIIDDDTDLCILLKAILKDIIPHIKFAHSIESGERLLALLHPDVIFLDNNLPDGQGVSSIKEIKSMSPGAIVVMITAAGFTREQSLKNGADLFLEKPLSFSDIYSALKSAKATN